MTEESAILVRRHGSSDPWTTPEATAYENEGHLQQLVASAPGRVPGVADEAVTVRELVTTAGPVDVCIVAPDGSLTVVECKLASSSEKRRMVIGQLVDYAAAISQDGEASFLAAWARVQGVDLATTLTPAAYAQLGRNIAEARINLCLAVDRIDAELRRLIEYLNRVTLESVSVTAIQLSYARDGDIEILIPSTYGGEIAAAKLRASGRGTAWTRASFIGALASDADRAAAVHLFERLEHLDRRGTHQLVWYGASPGGGVFFHPYGLRYSPVQLWANKAGQLMLYGNWGQYPTLEGHSGFAELAQFLGQEHDGRRRGVPVASLDLDELWAIVIRCSEAINHPAQGTTIVS